MATPMPPKKLMMPDIHFVTALPCEAQPLIEFYRLKPAGRSKSFEIYEAPGKHLVLSGVGKIRAAEAVRFLHEFAGKIRDQAWLNVGIGGHPDLKIGEGVLAHKITDQKLAKSWYPPLVFEAPSRTESVVTVERAENKYGESCVYEMEASGFYEAACRFSTAELIHCYKIISDNRESSTKKVSAALVERLVRQNLEMIDEIVKKILTLAQALPHAEIPAHEFQKFLERWHFTVTEQHQLRRLLLRLQTLEPEAEIWPELQLLTKSKDVLNTLKDRINSLPVAL